MGVFEAQSLGFPIFEKTQILRSIKYTRFRSCLYFLATEVYTESPIGAAFISITFSNILSTLIRNWHNRNMTLNCKLKKNAAAAIENQRNCRASKCQNVLGIWRRIREMMMTIGYHHHCSSPPPNLNA